MASVDIAKPSSASEASEHLDWCVIIDRMKISDSDKEGLKKWIGESEERRIEILITRSGKVDACQRSGRKRRGKGGAQFASHHTGCNAIRGEDEGWF